VHCYAAHLGDCERGPSREHYISKSVLKLAGNTVLVSGFPWQKPGQVIDIGIGSLASKILCGHHNAELSSLDESGRAFLANLKSSFDAALGEGEFSDETFSIAGDKLELWLLKILCGILTVSRASAPEKWIEVLFQRQPFPDRAGIHFFGMPGPAGWYFNLLRVISVPSKQGNIAGAKFGIGGLEVLLAFGKPQFMETEFQSRYRPESLLIHRDSNTKKFDFSWGDHVGEGSVVMRIEEVIEQQDTERRAIVKRDRQ